MRGWEGVGWGAPEAAVRVGAGREKEEAGLGGAVRGLEGGGWGAAATVDTGREEAGWAVMGCSPAGGQAGRQAGRQGIRFGGPTQPCMSAAPSCALCACDAPLSVNTSQSACAVGHGPHVVQAVYGSFHSSLTLQKAAAMWRTWVGAGRALVVVARVVVDWGALVVAARVHTPSSGHCNCNGHVRSGASIAMCEAAARAAVYRSLKLNQSIELTFPRQDSCTTTQLCTKHGVRTILGETQW